MSLEGSPQSAGHTMIIQWHSTPFAAHESFSPLVRGNLEHLHAMRLVHMMVQYIGYVRSVVSGIMEHNAPGTGYGFHCAPPSVEQSDEGVVGTLTMVLTNVPDQLRATLDAHIAHTLEGLHQDVRTS